MYIVKVYLNYQLVDVNLYEDYEHFLSNLTCKSSDLYDHIPKEKIAETDFEHPWIVVGSEDELGFGGDYGYSEWYSGHFIKTNGTA